MQITLTGKEIRDWAEYAGYKVSRIAQSKSELKEMDEGDFTLLLRDDGKPWNIFNGDTRKVENYNHLVVCDGCDSNEAFPLGDRIVTEIERAVSLIYEPLHETLWQETFDVLCEIWDMEVDWEKEDRG